MNVLVYADLHVAEGHEKCRSDPDIPLQRYRVDMFFDRIYRVIREYNCNSIWDLGDTTDDRTSLPIPTICSLVEGLSKLRCGALNIKLVGNHEQYHKNSDVNLGCLYKDKFEVVSNIEAYEIQDDNVVVLAIPYQADASAKSKLYEDYINEIKSSGKKVVVLGHCDVIGARYRGSPVMSGVKPESLARADVVLLGHIHKPQDMGNIHYIGSPFQQNFGEMAENKRVLVFNTLTLECTWIKMDGFPTYNMIEYREFDQLTRDTMAENRYQVVLRSADESSRFYSNPLSGYCIPVYDYGSDPVVSSCNQQHETIGRWDIATSLTAWMSTHPVTNYGLSNDDHDDVYKSGLSIAANRD